MSLPGPLQVRPRPRSALIIGAILAVVAVAFAVWFAHNPPGLPTTDEPVSVNTPVDQPVYVGVFTPAADFDRTLSLSGVKVHTTSNTEVEVVPLLCRQGTVGVTSEPDTFCQDLVNPEGQTFGAGDAIVLEVTSDVAAIAVIDRVRLGFREGLRWGTEPAGAGAVVRVLGS